MRKIAKDSIHAKGEMAKLDYHIHTDAIKENLIPPDLYAGDDVFTSEYPPMWMCGYSLDVQKDKLCKGSRRENSRMLQFSGFVSVTFNL